MTMKMGRAVKWILCLGMIMMLGACSMPEELREILTEDEPPVSGQESGGSGYVEYEGIMDGTAENQNGVPAQNVEEVATLCGNISGLTQEELNAWNEIGMNDSSVELIRSEQNGLYYYECLNEQEQLLYAQILMILRQSAEKITVSETDGNRLDKVFQAVLADHPEIFYVSGYTYTQYLLDGVVQRIAMSGTYTLNPEQVAEKQQLIEQSVAECIAGLPLGDDFDKLCYLYEYVIDRTEYFLNAPDNQNICSVFLGGESVCQGYAKAYQYLCRRAGLEATLVTGTIRESGYGHAWNLVSSNGAYYYVDVTWGDASYSSGTGMGTAKVPGVNYEYLCITTDEITKTHEIDTVVAMPHCIATEDNYYVRRQAEFGGFDEAALQNLFANADVERQNYVTFRCTSDAVYEEYRTYLIAEQKIFNYMNSGQGISYAENPVARTLSFWLP